MMRVYVYFSIYLCVCIRACVCMCAFQRVVPYTRTPTHAHPHTPGLHGFVCKLLIEWQKIQQLFNKPTAVMVGFICPQCLGHFLACVMKCVDLVKHGVQLRYGVHPEHFTILLGVRVCVGGWVGGWVRMSGVGMERVGMERVGMERVGKGMCGYVWRLCMMVYWCESGESMLLSTNTHTYE